MRLIDADALIETMRENAEGNEGWYGDTWAFMRDVENAPTIDAGPHWIPCEERLPENKSEVLVTDMNGHIRHALYNAVWDRFGTYEESMTVRAIAWMPLPEPYEGERKDDE